MFELIDSPERVFPVGRLNPQTTGLLLLTNDGTLANRLMNPRYAIEQEYVIDVEQAVRPIDVGRFQRLGKTRLSLPTRFAIILEEGRQRDLVGICEELGYRILNLMRTRIGTLKMPTTYPEGNWRHLTQKEVRDLKNSYNGVLRLSISPCYYFVAVSPWTGGVARLTRLPVTEKIEGSNPFRSARTTSYRSDPVGLKPHGRPIRALSFEQKRLISESLL